MIAFADADGAEPSSSEIAHAISRAARASLDAGKFDVALRPLSAEDVKQAAEEFPVGHDRLARDGNLVLLDAGALIAFAPYRARVVLASDPFDQDLRKAFGLDADSARMRLHDALIGAESIVALGRPVFDAVAPLLPRRPDHKEFPPVALREHSAAEAPILVVNNEEPSGAQELTALLTSAFPAQRFLSAGPRMAFEHGWKAVLQIGAAISSRIGERLCDAWAGGVPLLQLVDPASLGAHRRRQAARRSEIILDHGKSGLLFESLDEFTTGLGDFLIDPLPARAVARAARRRVDSAADWDTLLKAVLQ